MLEEYHHHSASSLTSFLEYRATWFLKKYRDMEAFTGSPDTARGHAVEAGVQYYMLSKEEDEEVKTQESIKAAHECFVAKTIGMTIDPEFRASINPCVLKAIKVFDSYPGPLISTQEKIELRMNGLELPIIGYLDFHFPSTIVDCKVTSKTPSQLKQSYIMQGSIYRAAKNKPVVFEFTIPLKSEVKSHDLELTDEEFDKGLKLVFATAKSVEKILSSEIDGRLMEALFMPNPTSIWNKAELANVMKAFGL